MHKECIKRSELSSIQMQVFEKIKIKTNLNIFLHICIISIIYTSKNTKLQHFQY